RRPRRARAGVPHDPRPPRALAHRRRGHAPGGEVPLAGGAGPGARGARGAALLHAAAEVPVSWGAETWLWVTLALVLAGGALLFYASRARLRALARFGDSELVKSLRDGSPAGWRAARAVMLLAALALVGMAAARPLGNARTDVVARRGIDIVVAL